MQTVIMSDVPGIRLFSGMIIMFLMLVMVSGLWAAEPIPPGETLDLPRCLAIARERHPSILAAGGSLRAGQSKVAQARANYYPQAAWSSTVTRSHPAGGIVGDDDAHYDQYQNTVNLNQTLYDFGKTSGEVKVQSLGADAARAELQDVIARVDFEVKKAYFGVLQARRKREAQTQTVQQFEQHLASARKFYAVGVKSRIDVTKAEVDLGQARLDLLTAANDLKLARMTLSNAMGVPEMSAFEVQDTPPPAAAPLAQDEALARAYNRRADLLAAIARREAAQRSIDLARTGYYPVLAGNAGYGWSGRDFPLDKEWSLGAGLSFPLFSGFSTRAQIDEARANLDTARANEELVKQTIRLDIAQASVNIADARERIALTAMTVRQAQENRELAEGRYAAGVGNALEASDALVAEVNAKTTYINAVYAYQVALATLAKAMGEDQ